MRPTGAEFTARQIMRQNGGGFLSEQTSGLVDGRFKQLRTYESG
jgi:hypothetical protein